MKENTLAVKLVGVSLRGGDIKPLTLTFFLYPCRETWSLFTRLKRNTSDRNARRPSAAFTQKENQCESTLSALKWLHEALHL